MAKKQPFIFLTLAAAINTYKQQCKPAQDLEVAVAKAIFDKLGKEFTEAELAEYLLCGPHQWPLRMKCNQQKRAGAITALVNAKHWNRTYRDFEDLYDTITRDIGKTCKGVGFLTCYDIAKKLSGIFNPPIYPDTKVYLQSGALKGAYNLTGNAKYAKKALVIEDTTQTLAPTLASLSSIDIENFLCIFKSVLVKGGANSNLTFKPYCIRLYLRGLNPQLQVKIQNLASQLQAQGINPIP